MGGTAVELLPGGLLDRLVATAGPDGLSPVRAAAAAGAFVRAHEEVTALRAGDPVSLLAWEHYTWHSRWLGLPDGDARPMGHLLLRMFERPPRPRRERVTRAEDWIVGRLLTDLRDTRATLSPQLLSASPAGTAASNLGLGIASIDEARERLADRPDLLGHLDLLAADLAARADERTLAEEYLTAAQRRLTDAGDRSGLAAAALLLGDLRAAPLMSPLGWNCVLSVEPSSPDCALAETVEAAEFDGSTVDSSGALAAYATAAQCYEATGGVAGLAAVALRHCYLALLDGDPAGAIALAERAGAAFAEEGRPLDAAVAACHGALAAIADDRLAVDAQGADRIVAAGRATIGDAPTVGLGLLCTRMARYWASRGRRPERARAALGLAERIFAGIAEPVLRSQTVAEIAQVAASVGDVAAVRIAVRDALAADAAPLVEPADPTDDRRIRRALLAGRLYTLASGVRDVDGMRLASRDLEDALGPLRTGLAGYTGRALVIANHLLTIATPPGHRIVDLLYRAREARDAGASDVDGSLVAQARADLELIPSGERDLAEALLLAHVGDRAGASEAFARHTQRELAPLPAGGQEWRMAHVAGLAFQLTVGHTARAAAHHAALVAARTPWWAGLGPDWQHLSTEGRLREQQHEEAAALEAFDRALEEIEGVRAGLNRDDLKTWFFSGAEVQNTYLDAIRVALRLGEHGRAFGYAERARARALLDLLSANAGVDHAGLPEELVRRWRWAGADVTLARGRLARALQRPEPDGAEIAELRARLDRADERLRAVEAELQAGNSRFWRTVNPQAETRNLADVAAALPPGVAVLQYAVGRYDLLSWAVTRDGMVAAHRAEGEHGIQGLVAGMLDACATGDEYAAPAERLADLLLEPLRPVVEAATALLLVPSGPLARLPFAALPWNGSTLGAAVPLTVLPSASASATARPAGPAGGRSLVVGDPSGMAYVPEGSAVPIPQPALPAAGVEAWRVAGLLGGAVDLLLGDDATEARVRALLPDAAVVHLATHGVLDPNAPLATAVLLASGESLTAAELFGQRLNADLVVLSACRTGTGTVVRGDELLGLGRAVLAAGARSVVVTLWSISDLSATLFMSEFHRRRLAGESDARALRAAGGYLRALSREEAVAAFEGLRAGAERSGDGDLVARLDRAREIGGWSRTSAPFAHPYHWAPYVLVSAGVGAAPG
ncbi:hypothetical protein Val02_28620 [Virgisporangium aliadipatigenens]|uniref:CHAT domain-containing protein n=1 Tax=Virgisporangium aliadipatigenens TaxID=741659 RepID=A0A8J3YIY5_9ACTN|nr:CHAT domain-containing protein [Virgisporangium aliadipatigenens]GIJ45976.1 hypothetical protein Val02_28620 [Virgisporangium aliadipatigenens]